MERQEFLEIVSSKTGVDIKEVEKVFQKFIDSIITTLKNNEKVNLSNFGTFTPTITKATKKFSALLNREIEIPEKFTISFSPSSKLAKDINLRFKDEKPIVIKEASEREIENKVKIIPPEKKDELTTDRLEEKISKPSDKSFEDEIEHYSEKDISLSAELLEILKEVEEELQEKEPIEQLTTHPDLGEKKEYKEEAFQMPEMNLNQDKTKLKHEEEITSQLINAGSHQPKSSTIRTDSSHPASSKEVSRALWITLIVLLIGIIGVGIYWALSSDILERKKEIIPSVVEHQPPTTDEKKIITAPEQYPTIPSDTSVKQKVSVEKDKLVEKKKSAVERKIAKSFATSRGNYFIQVNSFSGKGLAETFAKNLRNKGYRAFVETSNVPGFGKMYRVKVGFYKNEDAVAKDYYRLKLLLKQEDIFVDRR